VSNIEWVSVYLAVTQLGTLWSIPFDVAEQIVRNVIEGGRVEVRAVPHGHIVPVILTERVQFLLNSLYARGHDDLEIDWNGLLVEGRKLIPIGMVVTPRFGSASKDTIIREIRAVYDEAENTNGKPPNIREIIAPVRHALQAEGVDASGKHIQELASSDEFRKRRRKRGATVKSERRRQHQ
jgi:hypothetical protein